MAAPQRIGSTHASDHSKREKHQYLSALPLSGNCTTRVALGYLGEYDTSEGASSWQQGRDGLMDDPEFLPGDDHFPFARKLDDHFPLPQDAFFPWGEPSTEDFWEGALHRTRCIEDMAKMLVQLAENRDQIEHLRQQSEESMLEDSEMEEGRDGENLGSSIDKYHNGKEFLRKIK